MHGYTLPGCSDWNLRLVNGSVQQQGTVEVCFNNTYGSICHDHWSNSDAQVVCRYLGYSSDNASSFSHAFYGASSGPIHLTSVQCVGNEQSLAQCSYTNNIHECTHEEDAGVSCLGKCIYTSRILRLHLVSFFFVANCQENFVQLEVDLSENVIQSEFPHYIKDGRLSVGRVEVCIGGRFGTICDNYWDYKDASVICSQLRFSPHGIFSFFYTHSTFYYVQSWSQLLYT